MCLEMRGTYSSINLLSHGTRRAERRHYVLLGLAPVDSSAIRHAAQDSNCTHKREQQPEAEHIWSPFSVVDKHMPAICLLEQIDSLMV
jgi:hypothetical protein